MYDFTHKLALLINIKLILIIFFYSLVDYAQVTYVPIFMVIARSTAEISGGVDSTPPPPPPRPQNSQKSPAWLGLTLKRPGGGLNQPPPPPDILRDHSAAHIFLTAPLADFLLSSLAHLMTPFSRKSGIPLRRCTTFYTCSSDRKWLKNVILCTKSM